jgi:hypothetical protein
MLDARRNLRRLLHCSRFANVWLSSSSSVWPPLAAVCSQKLVSSSITRLRSGAALSERMLQTSLVFDLLLAFIANVRALFSNRIETSLEILALRQQVAVLKRKRPRPSIGPLDRLFWSILSQSWSRWADALLIVKPETVVGWHRAGFRLYWRWRSRSRVGRSKISQELRVLIR